MITKESWTPITRTENIPPREGRAVRAGGLELAIFNLADRFATIEKADRILVLEDGRIAEFGRRLELACNPRSRFAQLLNAGIVEALV